MKKIYFLLICILLFQFSSKAQTYKKAWASLTEDSTNDYFYLNDMVVDVNGNTFMSGYEVLPGDNYYETHFILIKVNANGEFGWKRSFSDKKDSIDEAIAVDADSLGNVYVTGRRLDTFCNICTYNTKVSDIITMKFDGDGNRLWLNRYHVADYILAAPTDIVVSKDGTLIITGSEEKYVERIGTYATKMLVEKIGKKGQTLWVRKRPDEIANSACFDNEKNIFIAGGTNDNNIYQTRKPEVFKYDASGNLIWNNIFNEYEKNGEFYFIHCDAKDNVYANGQTDTLAFYNHPHILTAKYSNDGLLKWSHKELDHSYTLPHYYGDFKVDAAGNCYVSGRWEKSDYYDNWLTAKYDFSGEQKWQVTYDGGVLPGGDPAGLAIDKKGNVYVAGSAYGSGGHRLITSVIYDVQGALVASKIFKPVGNNNAITTGIGLDKNDNVYVGGSMAFNNNLNGFYAVIKYTFKDNPPSFEYTSATKLLNNLKLFPNPVSSSINITFTTSVSSQKYNLIISDVSGNIMLTRVLNNSDKIFNLNLNVRQLKPGIYTATISNGVNTISKTFIKQ